MRIECTSCHSSKHDPWLALTALMAVSGNDDCPGVQLSSLYAGRAPIGIVIGGFWSMSARNGYSPGCQRQVPRALAIFNGGNALTITGRRRWAVTWGHRRLARGAFWRLLLAMVASSGKCVSLPSMKSQRTTAAGNRVGSVPPLDGIL